MIFVSNLCHISTSSLVSKVSARLSRLMFYSRSVREQSLRGSILMLSSFLRDYFPLPFWRDKANPMCLSWKFLRQTLVSHGCNPLLSYAEPNPQGLACHGALHSHMCWLRYPNVTPCCALPSARPELAGVPPREWHFFEIKTNYLILERVGCVSPLAL